MAQDMLEDRTNTMKITIKVLLDMVREDRRTIHVLETKLHTYTKVVEDEEYSRIRKNIQDKICNEDVGEEKQFCSQCKGNIQEELDYEETNEIEEEFNIDEYSDNHEEIDTFVVKKNNDKPSQDNVIRKETELKDEVNDEYISDKEDFEDENEVTKDINELLSDNDEEETEKLTSEEHSDMFSLLNEKMNKGSEDDIDAQRYNGVLSEDNIKKEDNHHVEDDPEKSPDENINNVLESLGIFIDWTGASKTSLDNDDMRDETELKDKVNEEYKGDCDGADEDINELFSDNDDKETEKLTTKEQSEMFSLLSEDINIESEDTDARRYEGVFDEDNIEKEDNYHVEDDPEKSSDDNINNVLKRQGKFNDWTGEKSGKKEQSEVMLEWDDPFNKTFDNLKDYLENSSKNIEDEIDKFTLYIGSKGSSKREYENKSELEIFPPKSSNKYVLDDDIDEEVDTEMVQSKSDKKIENESTLNQEGEEYISDEEIDDVDYGDVNNIKVANTSSESFSKKSHLEYLNSRDDGSEIEIPSKKPPIKYLQWRDKEYSIPLNEDDDSIGKENEYSLLDIAAPNKVGGNIEEMKSRLENFGTQIKYSTPSNPKDDISMNANLTLKNSDTNTLIQHGYTVNSSSQHFEDKSFDAIREQEETHRSISVIQGVKRPSSSYTDTESRGKMDEATNSKVKKRKTACGRCTGCTMDNCEQCKACLDRPRNGGRGTLRQKCFKRTCLFKSTS